jgi:hypothetical protein
MEKNRTALLTEVWRLRNFVGKNGIEVLKRRRVSGVEGAGRLWFHAPDAQAILGESKEALQAHAHFPT